jgi:hypothetical protein
LPHTGFALGSPPKDDDERHRNGMDLSSKKEIDNGSFAKSGPYELGWNLEVAESRYNGRKIFLQFVTNVTEYRKFNNFQTKVSLNVLQFRPNIE